MTLNRSTDPSQNVRTLFGISARLLLIVSLLIFGLGCGEESDGEGGTVDGGGGGGDPVDDRTALTMSFGPTATVAATVIPGACDPTYEGDGGIVGEFYADIRFSVYNAFTGATSGSRLTEVDVSLSNNQSGPWAASRNISLRAGDEVCLFSDGAEEVDSVFDDPLIEDSHCITINTAGDAAYALNMSNTGGQCELRFSATGVVTFD